MAEIIELGLQPESISILPGGSAEVTVTVRNRSDHAMHWRLAADRVPPELQMRFAREELAAFGGEEDSTQLQVSASPNATDAMYQALVVATLHSAPGPAGGPPRGEAKLRVEIPEAAPARSAPPPEAKPPRQPRELPRPHTSPRVDVQATPLPAATLTPPGGRWQLSITNTGKEINTYSFCVDYFEPWWVVADPPQVTLMPGEHAAAFLNIHASATLPAEIRQLTLRTISHLNMQDYAETPLKLDLRGPAGAPPGQPAAPAEAPFAAPERPDAPVRSADEAAQDGQVQLVVDHGQASVEPGEIAALNLRVGNRSGSSLVFELSCEGLPLAWYGLILAGGATAAATRILPCPVKPGATTPVQLNLGPPADALSGFYPFKVVALVRNLPKIRAECALLLQVGAARPQAALPEPIHILVEQPGPVAPGTQVDLKVVVENRSPVAVDVQLDVTGVDPAWFKILPTERLSIFKLEELTVRFDIPLQPAAALAGRYPIRVWNRLTPAAEPADDEQTALEVQLVNHSAYELAVDTPELRDCQRGLFPIRAVNPANAPLRLSFKPRDANSPLEYLFDPLDPLVPPGGARTITLAVRAPAVGHERRLPFSFRVEGSYLLCDGREVATTVRAIEGCLVQLPTPALGLALERAQIEAPREAAFMLTAVNPSAAPLAVSLSVAPADGVELSIEPEKLELGPRGSGRAVLRAVARSQPPPGWPCVHRFAITATPGPGEALPASVEAELVQVALPAFELGLEPAALQTELVGEFTATLVNRGDAPLTVALSAEVPQGGCSCALDPAAPQTLAPGEQRQVRLLVTPEPAPAPGQTQRYELRLRAQPLLPGATLELEPEEARGELTVAVPAVAADLFMLSLEPPAQQSQGPDARYTVALQSLASAPLTLLLSAEDQEGACAYEFLPGAAVLVAPHDRQVVTLRVIPSAAPGQTRSHRFTVAARLLMRKSAAAQAPREVQGELEASAPSLPAPPPAIALEAQPEFTLALEPDDRQSKHSQAAFLVALENLGDAPLTLELRASDRAGACQYEFVPGPTLLLAPHDRRQLTLLVSPAGPSAPGGPPAGPFEVVARPLLRGAGADAAVVAQGQLGPAAPATPPRRPWSSPAVVVAVLVLVVFICIAIYFLN